MNILTVLEKLAEFEKAKNAGALDFEREPGQKVHLKGDSAYAVAASIQIGMLDIAVKENVEKIEDYRTLSEVSLNIARGVKDRLLEVCMRHHEGAEEGAEAPADGTAPENALTAGPHATLAKRDKLKAEVAKRTREIEAELPDPEKAGNDVEKTIARLRLNTRKLMYLEGVVRGEVAADPFLGPLFDVFAALHNQNGLLQSELLQKLVKPR